MVNKHRPLVEEWKQFLAQIGCQSGSGVVPVDMQVEFEDLGHKLFSPMPQIADIHHFATVDIIFIARCIRRTIFRKVVSFHNVVCEVWRFVFSLICLREVQFKGVVLVLKDGREF